MDSLLYPLCLVGTPLCIHAEPIFNICSIAPTHDEFSVHQRCYVTLTLNVQLPRAVTVDAIAISLVQHPDSGHDGTDTDSAFNSEKDDSVADATPRPTHIPPRKRHYSDSSFKSRHSSCSSTGGVEFFSRSWKPGIPNPSELKLQTKNEYTDNKKGLLTTSIVCKSPVKRLDSGRMVVVVSICSIEALSLLWLVEFP